MPKKIDIQLLIPLLKKHDSRAFGIFYDQYSDAIYGILCKIVRDEEEAQNLLQDSFVKVWRKIDDYEAQKGSFFTWVLNIARNTAIDFLRSKTFLQSSKNQNLTDYVGIESGSLPNIYLDSIGLIDLVEKLDKPLKQVIQKLYFEGFTHEEAAEVLGIPLGTIKTRSRNALKLLRGMF